MKTPKLVFVENTNNNEFIDKAKLVADIRRHIYKEDDAYEAYKQIADLFNEIEEEAKNEAADKKAADKEKRAEEKLENKASKELAKAEKHKLKAEAYKKENPNEVLYSGTTEEA